MPNANTNTIKKCFRMTVYGFDNPDMVAEAHGDDNVPAKAATLSRLVITMEYDDPEDTVTLNLLSTHKTAEETVAALTSAVLAFLKSYPEKWDKLAADEVIWDDVYLLLATETIGNEFLAAYGLEIEWSENDG